MHVCVTEKLRRGRGGVATYQRLLPLEDVDGSLLCCQVHPQRVEVLPHLEVPRVLVHGQSCRPSDTQSGDIPGTLGADTRHVRFTRRPDGVFACGSANPHPGAT